jgi:hypothetical protein
MSTEQGERSSSQKAASSKSQNPSEILVAIKPEKTSSQSVTSDPVTTPSKLKDEVFLKPHPVKRDQPSDSTTPSTPEDRPNRPLQVIAVSASKGPAAFFNLARKFLVTDEMCDLSALEGAIVTAVDAAHLLERSKLAAIVRVQTSYVAVEPRRKTVPSPQLQPNSPPGEASLSPLSPSNPNVASSRHTAQSPPITHPVSTEDSQSATTRGRNTPGGRELRRARIVITVKRTERYKQWLEENPLQAIIAGDDGDDDQRDSPIPTDSRESGFSSSHQQQKQR